MSDFSTVTLSDIPDLSGVGNDFTGTSDPFVDGWYEGTIIEQRSFTDQNGNERVFQSSDEPSQKGDSRNIKLQVVVKRKADQRTLNISYLLNYKPEDLTQESVQAVIAAQEKQKETGEWPDGTFRSFMSLQSLAKLQAVAGVRQLERNGNGGLNLHPLWNKTAYVKLGPDDRNPQYKQVKAIRPTAPKQLL